nr:hypothetical protein [Methylomarinum sp. Ch1-1]MDP4520816.1 hypothetical protein [Methylomarinum sp. Ch1-1]
MLDVYDQHRSADSIEQLFAQVPDEVLAQINKKMATLFKKISPERLVSDLNQSTTDSDTLLSAIMNEPNLFTALLMLRAADELGVDLGVSVERVLSFFEVAQPPSRSFRFPF